MGIPSEAPRPFRWNVAHRERLGTLIEGPIAPSYDGFRDDLLEASARVISLSDDADLFFVGRSLESMFDLLSGLTLETYWAGRLHLIHFSNRFLDSAHIRGAYPGATSALRAYLSSLGLTPETIASRPRPIAFVDVVSSGSTLGNLISQLDAWCKESDVKWNHVVQKVRIVGITRREKTSPKTWRWHQNADWTSALKPGAIKNISVPGRMYTFVADEQAKVSASFPPWRWGDEDVLLPRRDDTNLQALRFAVRLFDEGRQKQTRVRFAGLLAEQEAMRHRWFRSLVLALKQ